MRKIFTLLSITFSILFISCKKDEQAQSQTIACIQTPPTWCATVRCSPDGRPVCGCNKVTYSSACEAECSGVTSFTAGKCP